MQPEPKKPVVVYRRTPDPASAGSSRDPGYAPATAPLIIGFLLLLTVLLVLGVKSANKMTDVRLKAINLNNEARVRDAAVNRRELSPPFDIRVERARADLKAAQALLTRP